jgi:hypothetical protein
MGQGVMWFNGDVCSGKTTRLVQWCEIQAMVYPKRRVVYANQGSDRLEIAKDLLAQHGKFSAHYFRFSYPNGSTITLVNAGIIDREDLSFDCGAFDDMEIWENPKRAFDDLISGFATSIPPVACFASGPTSKDTCSENRELLKLISSMVDLNVIHLATFKWYADLMARHGLTKVDGRWVNVRFEVGFDAQ